MGGLCGAGAATEGLWDAKPLPEQNSCSQHAHHGVGERGGVHTLLHDSVRTAFTAEQRSKPQMCDTAQSHCEPEEPSTLILFRRGQLVGCAKWLERLEHVGALRLGNTGLRKE